MFFNATPATKPEQPAADPTAAEIAALRERLAVLEDRSRPLFATPEEAAEARVRASQAAAAAIYGPAREVDPFAPIDGPSDVPRHALVPKWPEVTRGYLHGGPCLMGDHLAFTTPPGQRAKDSFPPPPDLLTRLRKRAGLL